MATRSATFFGEGAWCFSLATPAPLTGNAFDDMESYADLAALNGLNGGTFWLLPYVDRVGDLGVRASDDFESYADSAAVNGLNGGYDWAGAFVDR